jgi:ATP-dependent protease HslVU (ClpYQ) ATPase subunit
MCFIVCNRNVTFILGGFTVEQSVIYLSVFATLFTAVVSFFLGKLKIKNDREQFYENKISELLLVQAKEIQDLREQVENLVTENQNLRKQLEKGNFTHERIIQ